MKQSVAQELSAAADLRLTDTILKAGPNPI